MLWGSALDGKTFPILPPHLASTIRCGKNLARWKERRAILVRQRDITLRRLDLGFYRRASKGERRVDLLNARINGCNKVIDALEVADAHEEFVPKHEIAKLAKRRKRCPQRKQV